MILDDDDDDEGTVVIFSPLPDADARLIIFQNEVNWPNQANLKLKVSAGKVKNADTQGC